VGAEQDAATGESSGDCFYNAGPSERAIETQGKRELQLARERRKQGWLLV